MPTTLTPTGFTLSLDIDQLNLVEDAIGVYAGPLGVVGAEEAERIIREVLALIRAAHSNR